ncbi:MAG: glycosyltransferase family 4 protein [Phycisphaeraceae bacterium]|nr:glycosyltransferase family 4 protein [Phycisphaeraceae bacterium]
MAEPMRLAYITSLYGRTSDTFIRDEVRLLRQRGHTVHTYSTRKPPEEANAGEEVRRERQQTDYILEGSPLRLIAAVTACKLRHPLRWLKACALAWQAHQPGIKGFFTQLAYLMQAAYLARRIEQHGIQHVHVHIPMNAANVAMLAAVIADVSFSMTSHGMRDTYDPTRWAIVLKIKQAAFTVFATNFGRGQAMMISPQSLWPKMHVVRCGLDRAFLDQPATEVPGEPRLLFVGRLSPEKGAPLLIEAVAKLRSEGIPVELTMIGDGPSRGEIERAIAQHQLQDAVTLLGAQDSERVRQELTRHRALVLASFAEGLPVVIMEAFAMHRPVISTWVAGIPELVENGVNGLLISPGSIEALSNAMGTMCRLSVAEVAAMGQRGAAAVRGRHDANQCVGQLETLLHQAISSQRSVN